MSKLPLSGLVPQELSIPTHNAADSGGTSKINQPSDLRNLQGQQRVVANMNTQGTQAAAAAQATANKALLPTNDQAKGEAYRTNYIASVLASQGNMGAATATIGRIKSDPLKAGFFDGHVATMKALGRPKSV